MTRKKIIYFSAIIIGVLFSIIPSNQALAADCSGSPATQFRSAASGNWYTTTTWECSDDGVFWQTPTTQIPSSIFGQILIQNGHSVSITPANGGLDVDQFTIQNGGSFTVNFNVYPFTVVNGTEQYDLVNSGFLDIRGNFRLADGALWSAEAGSTTIKESTVGSPSHTIVERASFDAESTMIFKGGSSTLDMAIGVGGINFGNLRFESIDGSNWIADTPTIAGMTVRGDFYVGPNVTFLSRQYTSPLIFSGNNKNFTIDGNLRHEDRAHSTLYQFTGTGMTINGSGDIQMDALEVSNGGSVALSSNIQITGTATVVGSLFMGSSVTSDLGGASSFQLASGGTLGIGSADGISSAGLIGNVQTLSRSFSTSADYLYNGSVAQATGSGLPATVNQLIVDNLSGVTLTSDVAVDGNLAISLNSILNFSTHQVNYVDGAINNQGTLQQTKPVNSEVVEFLHIRDSADATDKYLGVDIAPGGALGELTVSIRNPGSGNCTTNATPPHAKRCFTITGASSGNDLVTLWVNSSELNGISDGDLTPYRFGGSWAQLGGTIGRGFNGSDYYFASGTTTSFSPFLLGGTQAPTSVNLVSISAEAQPKYPGATLILLILGLSFVTFVVYKSFRPL